MQDGLQYERNVAAIETQVLQRLSLFQSQIDEIVTLRMRGALTSPTRILSRCSAACVT